MVLTRGEEQDPGGGESGDACSSLPAVTMSSSMSADVVVTGDDFLPEDGKRDVAEPPPSSDKSSGCSSRCWSFPKGEVLGLCYSNIAFGSVVAANVFLSTGLLTLARAEAGCVQPGIPCTGTVRGMHPDSLLTNIGWIGGLATSFTLPIVGSITDYTPYRRQVAIFSAVALVGLNASQIALSSENWFAMALVQVAATLAYFVIRVMTQAYVPELSDDVERQNVYNSLFTCVSFGSIVIFLITLIAASMAPRIDNIGTAKIGQIQLVIISTMFLGYTWWKLMDDRPAVDAIPPNVSVFTAGFKKIYVTSHKVCTRYKSLMWFLISAIFTGAGQGGLVTTIITIAMALLGMNSTQVGLLTFTIVLAGLPGGAVNLYVTRRFDPLKSLVGALVLLVVTTSVASAVLESPERQNYAYLFAALWGLGMAWSVASEQTLFATIIPLGANAELYGTWYFASSVLSWVPPLLFSTLNEQGVSMQWGMASVGLFFFAALLSLFPIGGYQRALEEVLEDIEEGTGVSSVGVAAGGKGEQQQDQDHNAIDASGHSRRRSSIAMITPAEILRV